MYETLNNRWAI